MDGLQALFAELYNRFLLRDFVGKIVPGGVLMVSLAVLFRRPAQVLRLLLGLTPAALVFLGGLTWILTLGVQNLFELSGVWAYFPFKDRFIAEQMTEHTKLTDEYRIVRPSDFGEATGQMLQFQAGATEGQKLQYERFVVIKEACGNLFATIVLSVPAWLILAVRSQGQETKARRAAHAYAGALAVCICLGLFRMHWQHVGRQWSYATTIAAAARVQSAGPPPECSQAVRARLAQRGYETPVVDEICKR